MAYRNTAYELHTEVARVKVKSNRSSSQKGQDRSVGSEWWNKLSAESQARVKAARARMAEKNKTRHSGGRHGTKVKVIDRNGNIMDFCGFPAVAKFLGARSASRVGAVARANRMGTRTASGEINRDHMVHGYRIYYADDPSWVSRRGKPIKKIREWKKYGTDNKQ